MASGTRSASRWSWSAAVVGLLAMGMPALAGEEAPRSAVWVGADAAIYLEVSRPGALIDRLTDPGLRALLGPFLEKAVKDKGTREAFAGVHRLAEALETTPERLARDLTGGGLVAAVEGGEPGAKPSVVLLVTPTDPELLARAHERLLTSIREDAEDRGRPDPIERGEYRGVAGYRIASGPAYAIVEGSLVVADGKQGLARVIDRALDGGAGAIVADPTWKARREAALPGAIAWGLARLDRLRALDPKRFEVAEDIKPNQVLLLGHWLEAIRRAPWASASLAWEAGRLGARVDLPTPPDGYPEAYRNFLPPPGGGAPTPIQLPGTILSVGLFRDLSALWEARADLLRPEDVQDLTKLDAFAGIYFGGRDFGSSVLGALTGDWRLIVTSQDYEAMTPEPDVKQPAFALIAGLEPGDADFATRLKVAFQSFVGLANLGAAQTKAPPLMLGLETVEDVPIATARFLPPTAPDPEGTPVHQRMNFSPAAAEVGGSFVLSASVGLARDLVRALKASRAPERSEATLIAEADGLELARLLERNRETLIMQNMLKEGNDREAAEGEVGFLLDLIRYLHRARFRAVDGPESVRFGLEVEPRPGEPR